MIWMRTADNETVPQRWDHLNFVVKYNTTANCGCSDEGRTRSNPHFFKVVIFLEMAIGN